VKRLPREVDGLLHIAWLADRVIQVLHLWTADQALGLPGNRLRRSNSFQ
jgi:hypothetical protein